MTEKIPDDVIVTQVNLDEPGPENGDNIVAEAEGDIHWEGTYKRVTLTLPGALLQLTYNTEDQESATNAAILIASAGMGLPTLDQAELEPDPDTDDAAIELDEDDQRFLLDQLDNPHSDYDDSVEGWVNYDTNTRDEFGRRVVTVTFEDDQDNRTKLKGRWALEYLDGSTEFSPAEDAG